MTRTLDTRGSGVYGAFPQIEPLFPLLNKITGTLQTLSTASRKGASKVLKGSVSPGRMSLGGTACTSIVMSTA